MTRTKAILDIRTKIHHSNSLAWVFEKLAHDPRVGVEPKPRKRR